MWMRLSLIAALLVSQALAGPPTKQDPDERAGQPRNVSPLAHPTKSSHFGLGRIGGGCLRWKYHHSTESPRPEEGTWGMDYVLFGRHPHRVFLDWCHQCGKQKPAGPYATDGPAYPEGFAIQRVREHRHGTAERHPEAEDEGSDRHKSATRPDMLPAPQH